MKQAVDPYASFRELTLRGMILGALITVIFTASNVYLGLKVGLTFASSIPAAVISMAVLKFFKGSNILENNMVQTQASAAGTLSSIRGYALQYYFYSAGFADGRLLGGLSVLADYAAVYVRWYFGRDFHCAFALCDGGEERFALSGRRGGG